MDRQYLVRLHEYNQSNECILYMPYAPCPMPRVLCQRPMPCWALPPHPELQPVPIRPWCLAMSVLLPNENPVILYAMYIQSRKRIFPSSLQWLKKLLKKRQPLNSDSYGIQNQSNTTNWFLLKWASQSLCCTCCTCCVHRTARGPRDHVISHIVVWYILTMVRIHLVPIASVTTRSCIDPRSGHA
jgi:hypothetical protein